MVQAPSNDTFAKPHRISRWATVGRVAWGVVYFGGSVSHFGLAGFNTDAYARFTEWARPPTWVQATWDSVFMAHPSVYASLIGGYELATGVLLLKGGRAAVWGFWAALAFHVALMFFGFGIWLYCLPAIALLAFILRAHLKVLRA